jgi:hypothetical protein
MLPNFLIIGASKAGTTSLKQYLRDHPQVFMPEGGELHYFPSEFNWDRGQEWYESHFAGAAGSGAMAVGEKSVTYTRYPHSRDVPARIAGLLPDAKLIYVVRHPVERTKSAYLYEVAMGREDAPVDVAIRTKPIYVDPSRYAMQIEQYLEHFPREQLLVITSEDFKTEREATMRQIFEFLAVDPDWTPPMLDWEFNRSADKREARPLVGAVQRLPGYRAVAALAPGSLRRLKFRYGTQRIETQRGELTNDLRTELEDMLRDDVARLRRYLGEDFHGWGIG